MITKLHDTILRPAFVIVALLPLTSLAQTTHNGTAGNWTNAAAWSAGVPNSSTAAVLTGTTNFTLGVSTSASAASLAFSNTSGTLTLDISNGAALNVVGAMTDPGAGTARIFLANTNASSATNRLTASSAAMANFILRNSTGQTNYAATDFNMTLAVQLQVGDTGTTGSAFYSQNGGTVSINSGLYGLTIGPGVISTNAQGPLSYDLNRGTLEALRLGAGNGDGNGTSIQRYLADGSYRFNFNAGTVRNVGTGTTLNIQNGFANVGTATNTMGWNTAAPLQLRLSSSGANVFNADGSASAIIIAPSVRVMDQSEGGTITKTGLGDLVFAGGNTANSNTWTGATLVSSGNVAVDYSRIAGQGATGATDTLSDAYSPASQLVLGGGGFTMTGRGSASAGSLTNLALATNSTQVTVPSTNGLVIGQVVSNANLPGGTYIRRLVNSTNIELSSFPTASGTGQTLDLGPANFSSTQLIRDVLLQSNATVRVNPSTGTSTTLLTFSNVSGSGALTKAGAGSLQLSGAVTHSGETIVSAGVLDFATASGVTNTLTGNLVGSGSIVVKSGDGVLILGTTNNAGNTFAGGLAVTGGTLQVGNATTGNVTSQRLTAVSSVTVASGASILLKNSTAFPSTAPLVVAGLLTADVTGVVAGGFHTALGELTLTNGGELRAVQGANATSFQSFTLNGGVIVTGTGASSITSVGTPTGGDGIHLAISNTAPTRVFDVADVTGDTNPDLTVSVRLLNGSGTLDSVGLTKTGDGRMMLAGSNSYTGTTVIDNGQIELATNGSLRFVIGASGINNGVAGAGSAFFRGAFDFDLVAAGTNAGSSWSVITVAAPSYDGAFRVNGFTNSGGTWTRVTNGVTYQFSQTAGTLSIPSSSTNSYGNWLTNYPSLTGSSTNATADPDTDGFANYVEYAFGGNPTVGTPALLSAKGSSGNVDISFIADTNALVYSVKSTTNLATGPWTNTTVTITNSPEQSGVLLPNYTRRQFAVPATDKRFFKVEAQ